MNLVNLKDGHPVRSGKKSYRFEVRLGDCGNDEGHNDCKKDRQRVEGQFKEYQKGQKGRCGKPGRCGKLSAEFPASWKAKLENAANWEASGTGSNS